MSVINENLMPNETILKAAKITSASVKCKTIIIALVLLLSYLSNTVLLTVSAVLFLVPAIMYLSILYIDQIGAELALTNHRAITKHGLLNHSIVSMTWSKVESVSIYQSFLGRKLNYGTINIHGIGDERVFSRNVANPAQFRKHAISKIELG